MPDFERARTIERVQRDQVVEALGLRLAQQLAHARALELEDAVRRAVAEHPVGLRIVQRDRVDVEVDALGPLDLLQRVVDQRQRAEAQEVHLQQADPLDLLHVPLGREFVALPLVERRVVGDRPRRDDDAGGVHRGVARHPLEAPADVEDLLHLRVLGRHVLEDRVLVERLVQRHVERGRDLLGDAVDVGVRHVQRAADVAHDGLRLHRAEGDDLRDVLAAVLAGDVVDDFAAAALAEVDVDVGHRHALGIQEALEDEVEVDRIDVGDAHATRRRAIRRPSRGPGPTGIPCSRA